MKITDIPADLRFNDHIILCDPCVSRVFEFHKFMQSLCEKPVDPDNAFNEEDLLLNTKYLIDDIEKFADDAAFTFHIVERQKNAMVGVANIFQSRCPDGRYELSCHIDPKHFNNGYGSMAIMMIRDIALTMLEPIRLEIMTPRHNTAGRKIAEKAGFELEATLKNFYPSKQKECDDAVVYIHSDRHNIAQWPDTPESIFNTDNTDGKKMH